MHIGDEMEISKEREAFEAEFSKIKSDIAFWLHTRDEEMQGYNHPVMCWFWYMWQAKKQATPEGFVLVNVDDLNQIRDMALNAKYASMNNDNDRIFSDIDAIQTRIEVMIEAQEQSHELD